jgi:hypothetical protein
MTALEEELLEALYGMVCLHCYVDGGGELDSCALSDNAEAMELLARHGRLLITERHGRRVLARKVQRVAP